MPVNRDLKAETENEISSTRSHNTNKISCNKNITNRNSKHRLGQQLDHVISACPRHAK
jgi:hypothetical protein